MTVAAASRSPLDVVTALLRRFGEVLRDGLRLWWLAPVIPLIVVLPEFVQHVAEIDLGMFESRERAVAVADDPQRMIPGYVKVAGLLLAILATIRFWGARRQGTRWYDLRHVAWKPLLIAFGLLVLSALPAMGIRMQWGDMAGDVADLVITVVTLPLLVMLVLALAGDRTVGVGSVYRTGWLAALRMIVFAAIVWLPLQWLHQANHTWAFGAEPALVWALMVFDSLVVGLLATYAGTALHHGAMPLDEATEPRVGAMA